MTVASSPVGSVASVTLRGWAVDPGGGRNGVAEVVIVDGVIRSITPSVTTMSARPSRPLTGSTSHAPLRSRSAFRPISPRTSSRALASVVIAVTPRK